MKIYLCPSDKKYHCSWEGQAEDILDHFEKEHDDLIHYNDTFNIDLETISENRLFLFSGEIYLAQIYAEKTKVVLKLRYLGPQNLAEKITYNINIKFTDQCCQADSIRTTPEGFYEVDISELKVVQPELKFITCFLNITKEFTDEDSIENVFIEQTVPTKLPSPVITENYESVIERYSEKEDIVAIDTNQDTDIANETEQNENCTKNDQNASEEDKKEERRNVGNEEDKLFKSEVVFENSSYTTSKRELSEVSYLSRSKSTAFEGTRRTWFRTKSTLSLSSIQETDSPIICTNCSCCLKVPIYICPNNHHFCEKCQPGICFICEMKITFVRDADLEKLVNKFSLSPCQFQKFGCPEKLLQNDLHLHEVNCTFCLYKCPISECSFEGQFKGLSKHLKIIHSSTKLLTTFILSFHNYPEAFLVNEEKGIFHCYVIYGPDDVEWTAKFCGPKERNFSCELKFKDGKMKEPVLLEKNEHIYSIKKSLNDLKRLKLKPKNAVLTIHF